MKAQTSKRRFEIVDRKENEKMKKAGIALVVIDIIGLLMAWVQGTLNFSGAPIGTAITELIGFLLPGIIGVVLIVRANKKEKEQLPPK